jgi:hypothetical protein
MSDYYASKELVDRAKAYSSLRDSAVGIIRDLAKATPLPTDAEPRASSALLEAARTPSGAPLFAHPWLSSCPDCGADLDTGWECTDCEKDWQPLHQIVAAIKAEKARGPSEPVSDPFKFKEPDAYKQTELPEEFCAWLTGTWRGERGLWRVMSAEQTDQLVDFVRGLCKERDEANARANGLRSDVAHWQETCEAATKACKEPGLLASELAGHVAKLRERTEKAETALADHIVDANKLVAGLESLCSAQSVSSYARLVNGLDAFVCAVHNAADKCRPSTKPATDEPAIESFLRHLKSDHHVHNCHIDLNAMCEVDRVELRGVQARYDGKVLVIESKQPGAGWVLKDEPKPASDVASAETDWHPILTKWLQRRDEGHPCSPEDLGAMVATLVRIELARGVK